MAGTITAGIVVTDTLSDGTNSTSATNPIRGSAKAWVNFNLATSTVRQSFNVSSITNLGTANAQVNFTNALTDADFSAVASCNQSTSIPNVTAFNASYVQVYFPYYNGPFVNPTIACVAVFR
jgi:hypothetical protein